jgi:hypothetical protein
MIFKVPIYNTVIKIHIGDTEKIDKKYGFENSSKFNAYVFESNPEDKHDYVVVLREGLKSEIIVHEVVHLVNFIFRDIQHETSHENDEPQAYLTQWLYKKIKKEYKKRNKYLHLSQG